LHILSPPFGRIFPYATPHMEQYSSFVFESVKLDADERRVEMRYQLDGSIAFLETLELPAGVSYQEVSMDLIERALNALHLIGGVSYYKTCCPTTLKLESTNLSPQQATFWNTMYTEGLGEFFYKNEIDPTGLINFPSQETNPIRLIQRPKVEGNLLVPIGGGKDSIVTVNLLKKAGFDITLLRMGSHPLINALAESLDLPIIEIERTLSPELFTLNEQGALNGHVPITAYLSFVSILTALIYGFDGIVMSNEKSAEEGNIKVGNREVNHQWSKSLQAERLLASYIHDWITPDLFYFSLLRPWSELRIVKEFSQMPQYFPLFTSCNRNWKILKDERGSAMNSSVEGASSSWCGECPKCASMFALFAAFLPKKTLEEIFGSNFFANTSLSILYCQLLGLEGTKPFECVGTVDETKAAFLMAYDRGDLNETPVMKLFVEEVLTTIKEPDALIQNALAQSTEHLIPEAFLPALNAHS